MKDDIELVREYAHTNSEQAFAALVARHVDMVYSVALRLVGNTHLAEEITQTVFIILARKASSLREGTVLGGWLCQTTRYVAARAITMRRRRENKEQEAYMQSTTQTATEAEAWMEIAPFLENAMADLGEKDQNAVVLRFFERRSFKELGTAMAMTEAAAKMRVSRAIEKMRRFFQKRGLTLSATIIAGALSANSVQAAPMGLAASVTVAAVKGTSVTALTITLVKSTLKYMTWMKIKTAALISGIAIATVGTATISVQQVVSAAEEARPAFAGYATPEATLQSLIWALNIADQKRFEAGCTSEEAERFRNRMAGKSEEQFKNEAIETAKMFAKYKINKREVISETEVHLHLEALGVDDAKQKGDGKPIMKMKKIGNQWKYAGDRRSQRN